MVSVCVCVCECECLSFCRQSMWRSVRRDGTGRAFVQEKRRLKAVFMERMELNQFPFDTQVRTSEKLSLAKKMLSKMADGDTLLRL